jgi:hypothetical protein
VLSLLPAVAPGPRHPCGGRRRDDHLFLHGAPHGGAAAACAVRRWFGSAWPRRCGPQVAGEGADTRARAFRRAPTRSGISLPHNRRWLARVGRCADRSRQHGSVRSHLSDSGSRRVVLRSSGCKTFHIDTYWGCVERTTAVEVRRRRGSLSRQDLPDVVRCQEKVLLQHEVLSLVSVVAPGPRRPCGGWRRDDHLSPGAPRGGGAAARAARRRFGSAWPRSFDPEVAGEGADGRARAFRRAPTRSGISLPHDRWLARV